MTIDEHLSQGISALKAGNRKQAQTSLALAVQSDPNSEDAWLWLGHSLEAPEKRKYCYQRTLGINPRNVEAWRSLGELYGVPPVAPKEAGVSTISNGLIDAQIAAPAVEQQDQIPSKRSWIPTFLFGLLLIVILVGVPSVYLIRSGLLDGYLMSTGLVSMPDMPPFYPQRIDSVPVLSPLPIPEAPLSERMINADPLLQSANEYISNGDCYNANLSLEKVITLIPDVDEPYYLHAYCLYYVLGSQRSIEEYLSNLYTAIFDLDQAIAIRPDIGNYYALRGMFYTNWAEVQELAVDRKHLYEVALQNFVSAEKLGQDVINQPELFVLSAQIGKGDCEAGLETIDGLLSTSDLSTKNYADIYTLQATAFACLGKLDNALESIRQSMQYGEITEYQKLVEAAILYQDEKPDEALSILDGLVMQAPNYGGDRYFLRGLIYLEKGDRDEAYRSMLAGGGNTWLHGGLYSYVQGKMGLQLAGDENLRKSIDALQYAEASMPIYYAVLQERIRQEILGLGSEPWKDGVKIEFQPTQVSDIQARLTPRPIFTPSVTPTTTITSTPLPSEIGTLTLTEIPAPTATLQPVLLYPDNKDVIVVDPQIGTGALSFSTNEQKVFRFQPAYGLTFDDVLDVVVYLDANKSGLTNPPILYELWDPRKGIWVSVEPRWNSTDLLYPADYVLPEGDLFLAVRNVGSVPYKVDNISVTIVLQLYDGSLIQIGVK